MTAKYACACQGKRCHVGGCASEDGLDLRNIPFERTRPEPDARSVRLQPGRDGAGLKGAADKKALDEERAMRRVPSAPLESHREGTP